MADPKSAPSPLSPAAATTTEPDAKPTFATSSAGHPTAVATNVKSDAPDADLGEGEAAGTRYELRDRLGEGGMGEVHLCGDHRIGRDIAMKVIRPARDANPDARRRFVREARVQGQLEHPSIVPVYDLGRDPSGRAYFTMRRVRGKTLEQVLDGLRAGDAAAVREWSRHKVLTAFGQVCLAVDFAHARGVLHRDLKPDNVMLGDFGEVYVLDWGLAKVMDDPGAAPTSSARSRPVTPDPVDDHVPRTAYGQVMGTPGYMAPEQIDGDGDALDPRTDVYALGAILFELLTLDPLHGRGTVDDLMKSTRLGRSAEASARAPSGDIAPELDAICVRATALRREDRFPRARDLYETLEAYLAGDRDVERRRQLARGHAQAAAEAAARALSGESGAVAERTRAMREVSRAVALDPTNVEAMQTLVRLFTEVPKELPREAREEMAAATVHSQRVSARSAALGYLAWLAFIPFILWMGVRSWAWGALCDLLFFSAAVASWYVARAREARIGRGIDIALFASTLGVVASAGVIGPFMLLPGVAAVNTILYVATAARSRRGWAIAAGCVGAVAPFALELAGILPQAIVFEHGALVTLPQIAALPRVPTLVFLLTSNVVVVFIASLFVARFRDALHASQERLTFHTWQLRQFVPGDAYGAVAAPSVPPRAPVPARRTPARRTPPGPPTP